jgi:hypothetical protein
VFLPGDLRDCLGVVRQFPSQGSQRLGQALWLIFILFFPLFGVFVYLIARPAAPDAFEGPAQVL